MPPTKRKASAPADTATSTETAPASTEFVAEASEPVTGEPRPPEAPAAPSAPPALSAPQRLNITTLKDKSIQDLTQIAKDLNVGGATGMRKQELIFQILKAQTEKSGFIFSEGVLE